MCFIIIYIPPYFYISWYPISIIHDDFLFISSYMTVAAFLRRARTQRYPKSLCSLRIERIYSSNSLSGSTLSNLFCQYIYADLVNLAIARISFSLNSPRRLWIILAVFSEELLPLNAASSILLNRHFLS